MTRTNLILRLRLVFAKYSYYTIISLFYGSGRTGKSLCGISASALIDIIDAATFSIKNTNLSKPEKMVE